MSNFKLADPLQKPREFRVSIFCFPSLSTRHCNLSTLHSSLFTHHSSLAEGVALFGLAFAPAPELSLLNPPASATRRFILQKARHRTPQVAFPLSRGSCSDWLSTQGFRFSFTPLPRFFSPFPHGTLRYRWPDVFSLRRWSSSIPPGFLVPRGTRVANTASGPLRLRGSHPLRRAFPGASARFPSPWRGARPPVRSHDPRAATGAPWHGAGLGSPPFARRYSGDRSYFLFLRLLRWFSSPGAPQDGLRRAW